jgi:aldehyde:ferredoxin oxidoreductase
MGILAVVVEGLWDGGDLKILHINSHGASLYPSNVSGLSTYSAAQALLERFGPHCSLALIGPAGEYRLAAASIAFTDKEGRPSRHAGRGGLGAVMGAKGLKAIVIEPVAGQSLPLSDPVAFKKASDDFRNALLADPVCGQSLSKYGSGAMMGLFNAAGALPTRNFSDSRFEGFDKISGERLRELTLERGGRSGQACMDGCVMRCSGDFMGPGGKRVGKWPDFETLWSFGPNTGISDLDAIARYDRLCDEIGVDTIDVGGALALLMEAGYLSFGDAEGALTLVEEIGRGSPIGRLIGSGAEVTGKVYGLRRVAAVKGQAMPAFDPRTVKGQGVTLATNPQGADHTAGLSYASNLLSIGGELDPLSPEGQANLSRSTQISAAAVDTLGLCLFVSFAFFENPASVKAVVDMLNARHGWNIALADLDSLGQRVLETELDFNRRAGLSPMADNIPEFFRDEPSGVHGTFFDVPDKELVDTLDFGDCHESGPKDNDKG